MTEKEYKLIVAILLEKYMDSPSDKLDKTITAFHRIYKDHKK